MRGSGGGGREERRTKHDGEVDEEVEEVEEIKLAGPY